MVQSEPTTGHERPRESAQGSGSGRVGATHPVNRRFRVRTLKGRMTEAARGVAAALASSMPRTNKLVVREMVAKLLTGSRPSKRSTVLNCR